MTPEEYAEVVNIFDQCRTAASEQERQSILDNFGTVKPHLRKEVESLLSHAVFDDTVPANIKQAGLQQNVVDSDQDDLIGTSIGSYRILKLLGTGGMGRVYEAEQEHPRRSVAVKVLRHDFISRKTWQRFEQECQILANLHHRGIAQVIESGTYEHSGREYPFYAMELVPGAQTVFEYADSKHLDIQDRLFLMREICVAVHHGHLNGILHRDLKPANILVDPTGQPKIIDFGVARVTNSDIAVTTMETDPGQIIGTLPYMSPEQCEGDQYAVDARADVYSLGVVLYELLSGSAPYNLKEKMIHEAIRIIREEEPTRLSISNTTLRGDIETIVGKALEKDKNRRYQSVHDMAGDISHYLNNEPIVAQVAGGIYYIRKFVYRHRGLVASICSAFVLLLLGVSGTTWQAVRATTNANLANTNMQVAEDVTEFLNGVFSSFRINNENMQQEVKIKDVFDTAASMLETDTNLTLAARIRLYEVVGKAYLDFGYFPQAKENLTIVYNFRQTELGDSNRDTLHAAKYLIDIDNQEGKYREVVLKLKNLVDISKIVLGENDSDTLLYMSALARAYFNIDDVEQGRIHAEKAYESSINVLGELDPVTVNSMFVLAISHLINGDLPGSQILFEKTVKLRRQLLGETDPDTLKAMNGLAIALSGQGKWDESEALHLQVIDIKSATLGPAHPATLDSMYNLALSYKKVSRYAESEAMFLEAIARGKAYPLPEGHWRFGPLYSMYGSVLIKVERYEEAEKYILQALEIMTAAMGPDDDETLQSIEWLVDLYTAWDKPDKAAQYQALLPVREDNNDN